MEKLISIDNIVIDLDAYDKSYILRYIANLSLNLNICKSSDVVFEELVKREDSFSTNLGEYIALPHIKSNDIIKPSIFIIKLKNKVYWDNSNVKLVISILMPSQFDVDKYLKLISNLSRKLVDLEFRKKLIETKDKTDILNIVESVIYKE